MENTISFYQLFSWALAIPFLLALTFFLAVFWYQKNKQIRPIQNHVIGIVTFFMFILPMTFVVVHYERNHWHGERDYQQIKQWETEAERDTKLTLRPDMASFLKYIEDNQGSGMGSLRDIKSHIDRRMLNHDYLTFGQYVAVQDFASACWGKENQSSNSDDASAPMITWYPVTKNEAKAFFANIQNFEHADDVCKNGQRLIF